MAIETMPHHRDRSSHQCERHYLAFTHKIDRMGWDGIMDQMGAQYIILNARLKNVTMYPISFYILLIMNWDTERM